MNGQLSETKLLDYTNICIVDLIAERGWHKLPKKEAILSVYVFVRDVILFGYNVDDAIPASQVLKDGYGQCNTKGILFMAILRALEIPCRIHGFMIDKKLQKGAVTGITYFFAPKEILHSWIEVCYNGVWYNLEGFILDIAYLGKLQEMFDDCSGGFCGYGVAVEDFKNPIIDWNENDTYIQSKGIVKDLGLFNSPDELFAKHSQLLSHIKKWIYQNYSRHVMNRNIRRIRNY